VIGGGILNTNGAYDCTIGGGNRNSIQTASHDSTIGGGYLNVIQSSSDTGTIAGGAGNNIGPDAPWSTIAGGLNSRIQSDAIAATIGGGLQNQVQTGAAFSTIPGGYNNVAAGEYSFAAGYNAQATASGSFVWSDGTGTATTSPANNSVTMRASGGYTLYTSTGTSGVSIAAGSGSWSSLSDRNAKQDFAPVNAATVLAEVAALPLTTWSYKTEPGVRHIGPMAQDFHAAFRVGEDDRHITEVDETGVALVAIQGLNQKLTERKRRFRRSNSGCSGWSRLSPTRRPAAKPPPQSGRPAAPFSGQAGGSNLKNLL
jgi:hypothetical protein